MNSALGPDPGLPGDFYRGWEGGVGTRSGVSNGCSIGYWAGQQGLGNIAEWLALPHHKTRSESRSKSNKLQSEFCCEFYGEFSCEFYQRWHGWPSWAGASLRSAVGRYQEWDFRHVVSVAAPSDRVLDLLLR